MRNRSGISRNAVALALTMFLLGACGGGSSGEEANDSTPEAGAAPTSAETTDTTAADSGGEGGGESAATDFPTRDIEFTVTFSPGGSTDTTVRKLAQLLEDELGTGVTVVNRPGGNQAVGINHVLASEPDGHSIGLSIEGLVLLPMVEDVAWEPEPGPDSWSPIAMAASPTLALFVGGDTPWETLDDLIEDARQRPGEIRLATVGRYSGQSFVLTDLEERSEVDFTIVPYDGSAEASRAGLSGEVDGYMATPGPQAGLVESGDVKALAVTGSQRLSVLPDMPTFEEAGHPIAWQGSYQPVFGPPGIPDDVLDRLQDAFAKVMASDEYQAYLEDEGMVGTIEGDEMGAWATDLMQTLEELIPLVDNAGL